MLAVILSCYRDFESRVMISEKAGVRSNSYSIVKHYVSTVIGTFTKQNTLTSCPALGSPSVESALKKLVSEGFLVRNGKGRRTRYARSDAFEN